MHTNFWNDCMGHNFYEWSEETEKATTKNTILKFPRYTKNLSYNSESIYSYGSTIAHLDLKQKTIHKLGYRSRTSSKHYIYAAHMLKICYDFHEVLSPCKLIHIQHLSYDDHT